jgi:hypothetical protein
MVTEIYKIAYIDTIDGKSIQASPLKIKYLKNFMDAFGLLKTTKTDDGAINIISECARIAMKQYCPELSNSVEDIQDNFDLKNLYKIIDIASGIKIGAKDDNLEEAKPEITNQKDVDSWDTFDLAKLESEVFLLGIWKNYDELETSLSIPELMNILSTNRELNNEEKKFLAAIQGINIDESSSGGKQKGQKEWEDLKARVFSRGKATDSNDILSLQGQNAKKAGFGIGMGLDYEDLRQPQ